MKQWIVTLFPERYRKSPVYWVGFCVALVLVAALILQLFHFEDMPIVAFDIYGSYDWLALSALLAVECMALPSLVGMYVPRWLYRISLACISGVGIVWFALALFGVAFEPGEVYMVTGPDGLVSLSWMTVGASAVVMVFLFFVAAAVKYLHGYRVSEKTRKRLEKMGIV